MNARTTSARRPIRRGPVIGWTVAAVAVVVAAILVIPVIWSATVTSVAEEDTTVTLTSGGSTAQLTLPAGWSWRPQFGGSSQATAGSPDRTMTVEFALVAGTDPQAAIARAAPGDLQPVDDEPFGAGRLLHARTADGDAVVGAVATDASILTFVSRPSPEYDAELASLLQSVEVTP